MPFPDAKVSLISLNKRWRRARVGSMTCPACHWKGSLYKCLTEPGSTTVWCPYCKAVLDDPIAQYKGQKPKEAA